jgi:hypothetical protein
MSGGLRTTTFRESCAGSRQTSASIMSITCAAVSPIIACPECFASACSACGWRFGTCKTQCFDRLCRGERVVGIFAPRVLIIFPNPPRPRVSLPVLQQFRQLGDIPAIRRASSRVSLIPGRRALLTAKPELQLFSKRRATFRNKKCFEPLLFCGTSRFIHVAKWPEFEVIR